MTPHPSPPTRALYAKFQWEKLQNLSLLTTILKALILAENSIASGCSAPWAPGRGARCASAHGNFPPPPPFWKSWIRHCYSMSGKLTQKCWGKKKKVGLPSPPPPVHQLLGDAPIKKKCPPPPPWSGSDWRPCRREPLICHKEIVNADGAAEEKNSEPPPPPPPRLSAFLGVARLWVRLWLERKKQHYSPPPPPPWSASDFRPCCIYMYIPISGSSGDAKYARAPTPCNKRRKKVGEEKFVGRKGKGKYYY